MSREVQNNMLMQTILRGHRSTSHAKMVLLENQKWIESNPRLAALHPLLDDVIDSFLDLSVCAHRNTNNDDNDNMLLATKGKEVAVVIQHDSDNSPDRLSWTSYGRKHIKNCTQFRYYYKCVYGNCRAKKWVQKCENNLLKSATKYWGLHTCEAAVISNPVSADVSMSNMIQFESQDQTITNSFVPPLPQFVNQETVAAVDTDMNPVWAWYDDDPLWASGSSFLP